MAKNKCVVSITHLFLYFFLFVNFIIAEIKSIKNNNCKNIAVLAEYFSINLEVTSRIILAISKANGEIFFKKSSIFSINFYLKKESTNSCLLKT